MTPSCQSKGVQQLEPSSPAFLLKGVKPFEPSTPAGPSKCVKPLEPSGGHHLVDLCIDQPVQPLDGGLCAEPTTTTSDYSDGGLQMIDLSDDVVDDSDVVVIDGCGDVAGVEELFTMLLSLVSP